MAIPRISWSGKLLVYLILFNEFFSQKIQHKALHLKIQLILSILWLQYLKYVQNGKTVWKYKKQELEKHEFEMNYDRNCFTTN